jgi:hypothetical protein
MSDAAWVAVASILVSLITHGAAVLTVFVRARYKWRNGGQANSS